VDSDAYFVLSRSKLLRQYRTIANVVDMVSYSYKTNPLVGDLLQKMTDCRFTLHSENSIPRIKDKSRIIFILQATDQKELGRLFGSGIRSFVADNETDLASLLKYLKKTDITINLMLRMRMKEYTVKTEKHYVYGMYSQQINELIPKLRENKRIEKLGVHFHRKTQNIGEWNIIEELKEHLDKETLECMDLLDIGGGMPVDYKNYNADSLPYVLGKISQARRWANGMGITMIAEPGRLVAAPCIELRCKVVSIDRGTIFVNCSVYNASMDTIVANTKLRIKGEREQGERYLVKGRTPDSTDILRYRVYLKKMKVGDPLTFLNAGAYTYSTDFCFLNKLKTVIVE
jgi:ornithine decarboxylase